jgi:hypothetical protein
MRSRGENLQKSSNSRGFVMKIYALEPSIRQRESSRFLQPPHFILWYSAEVDPKQSNLFAQRELKFKLQQRHLHTHKHTPLDDYHERGDLFIYEIKIYVNCSKHILLIQFKECQRKQELKSSLLFPFNPSCCSFSIIITARHCLLRVCEHNKQLIKQRRAGSIHARYCDL